MYNWQMSNNTQERGLLLRQALPYINNYRGKCFIFVVSGSLVKKEIEDHSGILGRDWAMCQSLGIHCVLCITEPISDENEPLKPAELNDLVSTYAALYEHCNRLATRGSYELDQKPKFIQGSWILARPQGIIDGIDMQHRGRVRRIAADVMNQLLGMGYILFVTPLAMDKQGKSYLLTERNLVAELIGSLAADKVLLYHTGLSDADYKKAVPRVEAEVFMKQAKASIRPILADMVHYCDMGAQRVHLLPAHQENALVSELLTAQGYGLMINADSYEELIEPKRHEMEMIKNLIAPLEQEGLLRPRSLKQLQKKIKDFRIIKQDDNVIGCAALSPVEGKKGYAELECVVIKKLYAGRGYGSRVLNSMEKLAIGQGYSHLIVLTTQAVEWFREKGFTDTKEKLPISPVSHCRNAKVLVKKINGEV